MQSENEILQKFKQFDYLNTPDNLIKILVSYIKPSFLFQSNILTPIQLGKSVENSISKEGCLNKTDLSWLHQNCAFNDDFNNGISQYNRRIGFLTGTYWAYHNYDKLGNPEYFGSFGYRKFLTPSFLSAIHAFDIILPHKQQLSIITNKQHFINCHTENLYISLYSNFQKNYPQMLSSFDEYLNLKEGYYHELYVMKKAIFFEFCEWIFPLLFSCLSDTNCHKIYDKKDIITLTNSYYMNDQRDIAFIMEIYTGFFCYNLCQNPKIHVHETNIKVFQMQKDFNLLLQKMRTKTLLSLTDKNNINTNESKL